MDTASILALVTTSTAFCDSTMDIASPVTHSALDFRERPSLSINYEGSHGQGVFPHVGCRGPRLDFFYHGRGKKFDSLESNSFECESWNLCRGWHSSRH